MRFFRARNRYSVLHEPTVIELEVLYQELQILIKLSELSPSKENFEKVFQLAERVAFQYANKCPFNFMQILSLESMKDYKRFQSLSYDTSSVREWALGAYLLIIIGQGNSINREEAQEIFDHLVEGMTPLRGRLPSLSNALFMHGQ